MTIRIKETGEIKELIITDKNGVQWEHDLIGGADDEIQYNYESEIYETTQERYDWWENYINEYQADEEEIDDLFREIYDEYGYEEACEIERKFYDDIFDHDYECHHLRKQDAIERFREDYL